jgi:hypothetical protein
MQLSEREKRYVLLLALMLLIAGVYFYYTLVVEPFMMERQTLKTELDDLQSKELLVDTQIENIPVLKEQLEKKLTDSMELVAPFYPDLPQDRIILLLQQLIRTSGLSVGDIGFTDPALQNLQVTQDISQVSTYRLKELSAIISGAQNQISTPEEVGIGSQTLPGMTISLSYTGEQEQLVAFMDSIESLGRTVTVDNLTVSVGEERILSGGMNLNLYAVDKPAPDPFMDWNLEGIVGKSSLFESVYQFSTPEEDNPENP